MIPGLPNQPIKRIRAVVLVGVLAVTATALALVLGALTAPSSSSAAPGVASATLTGTYRDTFTTSSGEKAADTLEFKNGKGTVKVQGQVRAHVSVKGSTLTAPPGKSCPTVGTYKIHVAGNHLTFTVIKDTCKVARKLILPGHTFTKIGG